MCKQFICHLMKNLKMFEYRVNCESAQSAIFICEGIFGDARVLDVQEA